MKIVEINMVDYGSTGKIMFQIADCARERGHTVHTYSKKWKNQKKKYPEHFFYGFYFENGLHVLLNKLIGFQGYFSFFGTKQLVRKLKEFRPDLIHLHNLHDSSTCLPVLFRYIKKYSIPVVWTLHDCWSFTGQCPHFTMIKCEKWKEGCHDCPQRNAKLPIDCSKAMWKKKKRWFTGIGDMIIVTPSRWLANLVKESYLSEYPVKVINNGVDLSIFNPSPSDFRKQFGLENEYLILSVALGWSARKGYADCLKLAKLLDDKYNLILVGVSKEQITSFPRNVIGIESTTNPKELAAIYSAADVFINTTYEDNYPTVNLEARACGLPVITYRTGGSPESAGENAIVVEVGDVEGMKEAIEELCSKNKQKQLSKTDAISADSKFAEYMDLFREIISADEN